MNLDYRFLYDTYEALTRHPAPGDIKILCKNAPRCVKIRDARSYPGDDRKFEDKQGVWGAGEDAFGGASSCRLRELKAIGVGLAIDDFGTGYSSLSYLRRFPVDYLKVDLSFVDGTGRDPGDNVLVAEIVDLAHALGLTVVAEYVDTEEQLALLREMKCDFVRGYCFAKPVPTDKASALLTD